CVRNELLFREAGQPGKARTNADEPYSLNIARSAGAFDDTDDVRHDAVQFKVLRRVNGRDPGPLELRGILRRNYSAHDHRHIEPGSLHTADDIFDQRQVTS